MSIKSRIRTIENYPIDGVMFRDITTLLADPSGIRDTIDEFVKINPKNIISIFFDMDYYSSTKNFLNQISLVSKYTDKKFYSLLINLPDSKVSIFINFRKYRGVMRIISSSSYCPWCSIDT